MLASQSFFVYGHSPPTEFLVDYAPIQPCRMYGNRKSPTVLPSRHSSPCLLPKNNQNVLKTMKEYPPRPCLRPNPSDLSKSKKKVVFADDHGFQLTHVRVMWEPSNVPPHWSVRPSNVIPPAQPVWELNFAQPASDYVDFRRRINEDNVSLENVILKEKEGFLTGTIKVKNIDFEKEVLVRSSSDNWVTCEDAFCQFVDVGTPNPVTYSLFDTFTFKIQLPVVSKKLDFCVCFRCASGEYWDSNNGANYTVSVKEDKSSNFQLQMSIPIQIGAKVTDPMRRRNGLWSEFKSWNEPEDVPYW